MPRDLRDFQSKHTFEKDLACSRVHGKKPTKRNTISGIYGVTSGCRDQTFSNGCIANAYYITDVST